MFLRFIWQDEVTQRQYALDDFRNSFLVKPKMRPRKDFPIFGNDVWRIEREKESIHKGEESARAANRDAATERPRPRRSYQGRLSLTHPISRASFGSCRRNFGINLVKRHFGLITTFCGLPQSRKRPQSSVPR